MVGFIKNLFTIKAYALEEEEDFIDLVEKSEEVEEKELKLNPQELNIINMLENKDFTVTKDGKELDESDENLEKICHFSFMSIEGSTAYADDYDYSSQDKNSIPMCYENYLTSVEILFNDMEDIYIIKEGGFTSNSLRKLHYQELIELIDDDVWETASF